MLAPWPPKLISPKNDFWLSSVQSVARYCRIVGSVARYVSHSGITCSICITWWQPPRCLCHAVVSVYALRWVLDYALRCVLKHSVNSRWLSLWAVSCLSVCAARRLHVRVRSAQLELDALSWISECLHARYPQISARCIRLKLHSIRRIFY